MAIKDMNPRLAEIGKIKIGGKGKEITKGTGANKKTWNQPVKFGHFKVTTTERGADKNFIEDKTVMEKLGEKPKEIRIRLPFDSIDLNFFTSYQYYQGRKCLCRGDGETATRIQNDESIAGPCNPKICRFMLDNKCKPSGILSCYIADYMTHGGVYRFRTHGWNSVSGILAALQGFADNTGGILQGLPLKLKLIKKNTEEHGNVDVVTIVLDGTEMEKLRLLAIEEKQSRDRLGINMKQIEDKAKESGFTEDTDDPAEVESEFYNIENPEPEPEKEPGASSEEVRENLQPSAEPDKKEDAQPPAGKPGNMF